MLSPNIVRVRHASHSEKDPRIQGGDAQVARTERTYAPINARNWRASGHRSKPVRMSRYEPTRDLDRTLRHMAALGRHLRNQICRAISHARPSGRQSRCISPFNCSSISRLITNVPKPSRVGFRAGRPPFSIQRRMSRLSAPRDHVTST